MIENPNELGAKLIKAELMGDEVNIYLFGLIKQFNYFDCGQKELVKSLKARLEVARKYAEKNPKKTNDSSYNHNKNQQNQRNHKQSNQRREGHLNKVDLEQAKMLKRNFHGNEYDDYGNGHESIVNFF